MKYSYVKQFFVLLVIMGKNRVQLHVGVLSWIDIERVNIIILGVQFVVNSMENI